MGHCRSASAAKSSSAWRWAWSWASSSSPPSGPGKSSASRWGSTWDKSFDPQFGSQGSIVGDLYFMLTLVVFLVVGGHRAMLRGVARALTALPLLSVGMNARRAGHCCRLVQRRDACWRCRLAAPVLVTMWSWTWCWGSWQDDAADQHDVGRRDVAIDHWVVRADRRAGSDQHRDSRRADTHGASRFTAVMRSP